MTPAEAAAAILRGEGKKLQRKDRKAEIARIRAELGLADAARTPAVRPLLIRIPVPSTYLGIGFRGLCIFLYMTSFFQDVIIFILEQFVSGCHRTESMNTMVTWVQLLQKKLLLSLLFGATLTDMRRNECSLEKA